MQLRKHVPMLLAAAVLALSGVTASADEGEGLDANTRAKLVKEKAKRAALSDRGKFGTQSGTCGNQSVANVFTDGGKAPREVTTVITGDVINVNDGRCR